ncbi:hypothetical protein AK830_g2978 [Neonectria ditissima]|uniref:Uncharacterized protein n=1 Tax=Neonectria ditissima TaxID=78410 RepID=A0A0P7BQZ5_9HYPO|nr:hypothetical protein AK830_g2978 [Neonectria ditissima]
MSNSPVSAQWSLSSTSTSALQILKGVMRAASSDNIQAEAIIACEELGSTLAMSTITIDKVVHTIIPTPDPIPISFLKATVGYAAHDCATQLGTSQAGVRFLGLAAALVTTVGPYQGAKALEAMFVSSKAKLTDVPSTRQLRDVLASLEPRCLRSDFSHSVIGYQALLLARDGDQPRPNTVGLLVPTPEGIAALVDIFRQLARIGSATVTGATIRVSRRCASWVLAFARWCLQIPPAVYHEGDDEAILDQSNPAPLVTVVISKEAEQPIKATIHHQLEDITQLLGPESVCHHSLMIPPDLYLSQLPHELGFHSGMFSMLHEALAYAIPQVLLTSTCGRFSFLGRTTTPGQSQWYGSHLKGPYLSPFPNSGITTSICEKILGLKTPIVFKLPNDCIFIGKLPLVSQHLELLKKSCLCNRCAQPRDHTDSPCQVEAFFDSFTYLVIDILALSLFGSSPPSLLCRCPSRDTDATMTGIDSKGPSIQVRMREFIKNGNFNRVHSRDILNWARNLVGHPADEGEGPFVVTYGRGQVIYPVIFDTFRVEKEGYLTLCSLQGTLRYQGDTYSLVTCPQWVPASTNTDVDDSSMHPKQKVSQPLNLFKDFQISWEISTQDDKKLHAMLSVRRDNGQSFSIKRYPMQILISLGSTLYLERCPHDPEAKLDGAEEVGQYSCPRDLSLGKRYGAFPDVTATAGSNTLRFIALARKIGYDGMVLRNKSCLACCRKLCEDYSCNILIA